MTHYTRKKYCKDRMAYEFRREQRERARRLTGEPRHFAHLAEYYRHLAATDPTAFGRMNMTDMASRYSLMARDA